MDRAKAKRLLNKNSWTGKEVGQASLYSLSERGSFRYFKRCFKGGWLGYSVGSFWKLNIVPRIVASPS